MIDALNLIAMGLCLVGLIYFLLCTRRVDDVRWGLRFCIVYALVCTSYLSYDAWAFYGFLPAPHDAHSYRLFGVVCERDFDLAAAQKRTQSAPPRFCHASAKLD